MQGPHTFLLSFPLFTFCTTLFKDYWKVALQDHEKNQGVSWVPFQLFLRTIKTTICLFKDPLGGLEVQSLQNGSEWTPAPPIDGSIVVNIGDLLQFWSGGKYRATPHRVIVNAQTCHQPRYSIAVFIHPNHNTDVRPILEGKLAQVEKTTAKDHINKRFAETYPR